eukprot:1181707-Prorocentrum_minimum.AAC.4
MGSRRATRVCKYQQSSRVAPLRTRRLGSFGRVSSSTQASDRGPLRCRIRFLTSTRCSLRRDTPHAHPNWDHPATGAKLSELTEERLEQECLQHSTYLGEEVAELVELLLERGGGLHLARLLDGGVDHTNLRVHADGVHHRQALPLLHRRAGEEHVVLRLRVLFVSSRTRAKGERSGRKWGTGHRVRKGKGLCGVECILAVIGTGGPRGSVAVRDSSIRHQLVVRRSACDPPHTRRFRHEQRGNPTKSANPCFRVAKICRCGGVDNLISWLLSRCPTQAIHSPGW